MIAFVRGRVAALAPDGAVVEVGGVGLVAAVHPGHPRRAAARRAGPPADPLVVREDSLTLYGFADDDERVVFELLQTASGVGPRLAQAMLAVHGPDELRRAVATEDLAALDPGARHRQEGRPADRPRAQGPARRGPTAARRPPGGPPARRGGWRDQLHGALVGLGWSAREADDGVAGAAPYADEPRRRASRRTSRRCSGWPCGR